MIQRALALLILAFLLIGATSDYIGVGDYAIVDDNPAPVRGTYPTVQAAIDSGAKWIDVRAGEYGGFSLNKPNVTIQMQGARFHNANDLTIWIDAAAVGATITGEWEIYGDNTGVALGDNFHGTGVYNNAPHVTLEGLRCTNLLAFCVLNPVATAHHVTIKDCHIENVATSPTPQLLAGTGIIFINGSSYNEVTGCFIRGQSQAIGTWYGSSFNRIHGNHLQDNYGWITGGFERSTVDANKDSYISDKELANGFKGDGFGFGARSDAEDYGVDGAINTGNQFYNNLVDGSNASAFELADELRDVVVRNNTVYNVKAGFWMGGSGDNKSLNATIEGNTFYGHAGVVSNWFSGTGRIAGNTFYDWEETGTTATIYIPSDGLGNVEISGNTVHGGNGFVRYSAPTGDLWLTNNRIETDTASWLIYFADTVNGGHVIADNLIDAPNTLAIVTNNDTQLTISRNTIYGAVWETGSGSVIDSNTIYCSDGMWTGLLLNRVGQVARGNRLYCNNMPVVVQSPSGAMVIDNFVAKLNGAAAALPTCSTANTCRDNWIVP